MCTSPQHSSQAQYLSCIFVWETYFLADPKLTGKSEFIRLAEHIVKWPMVFTSSQLFQDEVLIHVSTRQESYLPINWIIDTASANSRYTNVILLGVSPDRSMRVIFTACHRWPIVICRIRPIASVFISRCTITSGERQSLHRFTILSLRALRTVRSRINVRSLLVVPSWHVAGSLFGLSLRFPTGTRRGLSGTQRPTLRRRITLQQKSGQSEHREISLTLFTGWWTGSFLFCKISLSRRSASCWA